MDKSIGKYLFFIACFAFWLFLALFSSKLIVDNLTSGHHYSNAVFNLHYLKNTGAAFSKYCSVISSILISKISILFQFHSFHFFVQEL